MAASSSAGAEAAGEGGGAAAAAAEAAGEGGGAAATAAALAAEDGPPLEEWGPRLLRAARQLAGRFGGGVALPLLSTDHDVLEIGRSLLHRGATGGSGRLCLAALLEAAIAGLPEDAGVRIRTDCQPFPLIILVSPASPEGNSGAEAERDTEQWPRPEGNSGAEAEGDPERWPRPEGSGDAEAERDPERRIRLTPAAARRARSPAGRDGDDDAEWPPRRRRLWSPSRRAHEEPVKLEGVELAVVCGNVPVVTLDRGTEFDSNAAWLLQNVMGSHSKAESLYEMCPSGSSDERMIVSECLARRLADTELELGIVVARGREEVRAVGTCGKRSMMLALVVAQALHSENSYLLCLDELEGMPLKEEFVELIDTAKRLAGMCDDSRSGGSASDGGRGRR